MSIEQDTKEAREGVVRKIRWQSEETGWRIVVVEVAGKSETWVGTMAAVFEGAILRAEGVHDPGGQYGPQFKVSSVTVAPPEERAAIVQWISSLVDGIGPKKAERIVAVFGTETLKILDTNHARLAEVPGVSLAHAEALWKAWSGQRELNRLVIWLQGHGMSPGLAMRIVKHYGARCMEVVQNQPYRLALDIPGIGFQKADELAQSMGVALTDSERVMAGTMHALHESTTQGHCYILSRDLIKKAATLLKIGESYVTGAIGALDTAGRIKLENEGDDVRVFSRSMHETECYVAKKIQQLKATLPGRPKGAWYKINGAPLPLAQAAEAVIQESAKGGMTLSEGQEQAVRLASTEKVVILTGGPGCGKTQSIKAIVSMYEKAGLYMALAAPTGKAAKRIREATGRGASTIHMLLCYDGKTGRFVHNEESPLPVDVLVIDEHSMVDLNMMRHVLAALPPDARLLMVGDVDQLPSIGAGAVLRDLIDSGCVPTVRLTQIFRQASTNSIIPAAHAINHGKFPVSDDPEDPNAGFLMIQAEEEKCPEGRIVDLVTKYLPRMGIPIDHVQVLSPMRKGAMGTEALNLLLRDAINPGGMSVTRRKQEWRTGDRVMQTKNDYSRSLYNGDVGFIQEVLPAAKKGEVILRVRFEDQTVDYKESQLEHLMLAYACTVHRMQGSGFPVVVMPVINAHYTMLGRNLVYTGVTRGIKKTVLLFERKAMVIALAEVRKEQRNTRLSFRLRETPNCGAGEACPASDKSPDDAS